MEHVEHSSYFQMIWTPVASVGWYLVGFAIIAIYAFPHIQERYKKWLAKNQTNDAFTKKIDDLPQMSANVELARQKMQEAYAKSAALAKIKQEEEQEKKRQKVIKLLENKKVGERLGSLSDNEQPGTSSGKSKSFKSEYNPLMGDSTRGYRPPKRSCCKKGGCG
ncbi:uncharacterized protein LOC109854286 [Pseudomyrmex gracilis]|uniref:uncharacterized protein LOC109854286 n=1 Tax=Pseudomyrmex gracilis TaxID=219809 RepID=UPI0009958B30|nr:uncharacterized protein LOC109854286 [Pseudomyrmex gracilis]